MTSAHIDGPDTKFHFTLDEASGPYLSTVGGFSLAATGAVTSVDAVFDKGASIPVNGKLEGSIGSVLDGLADFTFWVDYKPAAPVGQGSWEQAGLFLIQSNEGATALKWGHRPPGMGDAEYLNLDVQGGGETYLASMQSTLSTSASNALVIVKTGNNLAVYHNKALLGSHAFAAIDVIWGSGERTLKLNFPLQLDVSGVYDDVWLEGYAYTPEQIDAEFERRNANASAKPWRCAYVSVNLLAGLPDGSLASNASAISENWKSYIKDERLDARLWADAEDGLTLTVDLGAAKAFDVVGLLNHNLGGGAVTAKVEAADDAGFTTNLVTAKAASTLTAGTGPWAKDTALTFASVTKRHVRVVLDYAGLRRVELGELVIGEATVLSRRLIEEALEKETTRSHVQLSDFGDELRWYRDGPVRSLELAFVDLLQAEADELVAMFEAALGGEVPLLFCERYLATADAATDDEQRCLYGQLLESMGLLVEDYGPQGALISPEGLILTSLPREAGS